MKGTSKLRSRHLSANRPLQRLRGCFLGDNAAVPPAYRVKVQKCASFVDIIDVCKFTKFCDRKGYRLARSPTRLMQSIFGERKRGFTNTADGTSEISRDPRTKCSARKPS